MTESNSNPTIENVNKLPIPYEMVANLLIQYKQENKELKEDNKKISRQIEDRINQMRKSGM